MDQSKRETVMRIHPKNRACVIPQESIAVNFHPGVSSRRRQSANVTSRRARLHGSRKEAEVCADELASTIEHAVKAAVDTVLCEITKVVGGKFTEFQMEMAGKEKENESLKLRLEISS
ncbi:UNVERIFIED_CONTAM: hypothetical protein FKN15_020611 [Acipenser sinensis]